MLAIVRKLAVARRAAFQKGDRTMKRILTLCLGAILLVGVAAFAAGAHGDHWKHAGGPGEMRDHAAFVAKALDLTDDQMAAAKKLHEELAAKAGPLMTQHHQQRDEVKALLDAGNADPAEVGQKVIAAHATGQQLKALHEDFKTRFSALLNADQLAKLQKLEAMHHDRESPDFERGPGF
jgi:Spy/CpxP family protein refolding chaperone